MNTVDAVSNEEIAKFSHLVAIAAKARGEGWAQREAVRLRDAIDMAYGSISLEDRNARNVHAMIGDVIAALKHIPAIVRADGSEIAHLELAMRTAIARLEGEAFLQSKIEEFLDPPIPPPTPDR